MHFCLFFFCFVNNACSKVVQDIIAVGDQTSFFFVNYELVLEFEFLVE